MNNEQVRFKMTKDLNIKLKDLPEELHKDVEKVITHIELLFGNIKEESKENLQNKVITLTHYLYSVVHKHGKEDN